MQPNSTSVGPQNRKRTAWSMVLLMLSPLPTAFVYGCGAEEAARYSRTKVLTKQDASAKAPSSSPPEGGEQSASASRKPAKAARKIIYDARIDLLVDSLNATEQAISKIIKENDGFLAESDQSSSQQNQRRATWRVRVPVANFDAFVAAVVRLGEVTQNHVGSQDVTEEYLDLDARIRNKREEEKRLLKHLADSTGKLEDILAVERELSRVRGEAEQMEGRLRYLADRAELSTVTIEANEWKDYKPPVAASFGTQISRTFFLSVERLVDFGKALTIIFVVLLPWIPLILIGLVIARLLILYAGRSRHTGARRPAPIFEVDH
jgi:Domain of unknown function (DUF4349)